MCASSRNSQRGAGILEVVMAAGILAIIILGVTTSLVDSQRASNAVEKNVVYGELLSSVRQALINQSVCSTSFVGQNLILNGNAKLSIGTAIVDPTLPFGYQGGIIAINSFKFTKITPVPPSVTLKVVELTLTADLAGKSPNATVGGGLRTTTFNLLMNANGAGVIQSCGDNSPTYSDQFWTQAGCSVSAAGTYKSCFGTLNLPTAMANPNYQVFCVGLGGAGNPSGIISVAGGGLGTTNFPYVYTMSRSVSGGGLYIPDIMCHAHHN